MGDVDSGLKVTVFENVDFSSGARVEEVASGNSGVSSFSRARLGSSLLSLGLLLSQLCASQLREHIFRAVNVSDKSKVVNLSLIIFVKILSDDEIKHLIRGREQSEILQDSLELLISHVAGLSPVEILEAWLQ